MSEERSRGPVLILCFLVGINLLGFSRYLFGSHEGPPAPVLVHFHFAAMASWSLLALVQAFLVGRHRVRLHQVLGWCSIALVAVLVGSALAIIRWSSLRD